MSTRSPTAALIGLLLLSSAACANESGGSNGRRLALVENKNFGTTGAIFPTHPWTVDYQWDCAKQLSEGRKVLEHARLQVTHADDGSRVDENAFIDKDGRKGSGVLTYRRPGAYVVTIASECDFKLKVTQETS